MTVIAIANRKGGVGKTTISLALATRLVETHKVLLIDLDSQANATEALGIQLRPGIAEWLILEQLPELAELNDGLCLMPSDIKTEKANTSLASDADIAAIDRGLRKLRTQYHYIIMDCPPSLSMLTRAAIYAADYVLCPTVPEYLSVAGVRQLIVLTAQIRNRFERPVKLLGIQPNMYRRTTKEHKANLTDLVRAYGAYGHENGRVWPPLRQSIAVAKASAEGLPLWQLLKGQVLREWEAMVERVNRYG